MSFVRGLACKACGTEYAVEPRMICEECLGPVEVRYDYEAMAAAVSRETIAAGPRSLWRYRDLLPVEGEPVAGLRSGFTPLVRADRLARELGVRELYIKDDGASYPTFSYKDRVVAVALTRAVEFGFDTVGCASTGNLAHSVAAHAPPGCERSSSFRTISRRARSRELSSSAPRWSRSGAATTTSTACARRWPTSTAGRS